MLPPTTLYHGSRTEQSRVSRREEEEPKPVETKPKWKKIIHAITFDIIVIMATKASWKIFLDLQCPYSKRVFDKLPELRARFGNTYDITTHFTALAFHPQAFTALCATVAVGGALDPASRAKYETALFAEQERFMNAALGDARKSEIDAVFADIAESAASCRYYPILSISRFRF